MIMDKIIWITGAGTGIGKALVDKLSEDGHILAVSGRRENLLTELSDQFQNVFPFAMDVSDKSSVLKTYENIAQKGEVDCLINNAGVGGFSPIENQSIESIENILAVNLLGCIYTIKAVLPSMIKNKKGTIINNLSVVTEKIFENGAAYTASKLGLLGFLDVMREEVRKYNIKVINILPGATSTPIWDEKSREEFAEKMMNPEDIAEIVSGILNLKGKAVPEKVILRSVSGDI